MIIKRIKMRKLTKKKTVEKHKKEHGKKRVNKIVKWATDNVKNLSVVLDNCCLISNWFMMCSSDYEVKRK